MSPGARAVNCPATWTMSGGPMGSAPTASPRASRCPALGFVAMGRLLTPGTLSIPNSTTRGYVCDFLPVARPPVRLGSRLFSAPVVDEPAYDESRGHAG